MDDDIKDALATLQSADATDVADALESEAPAVYKAIRTPAYKQGKKEASKGTEEAQEKIASLRKEKKALQEKITTLEDEQPEAAEIRGTYEEKLKQKQKELQAEKERRKEVENTWRSKAKGVKVSSTQERIASHLKSMGVDPDYADFRAEKVVNSGRVKVDDDELATQFYEDDDGTVPLHTNGTPADKAFAEDVFKDIPDSFIKDTRPGDTRLGDTGTVSGGELRVPRSEIGDDLKAYEKYQTQAEESGKELVITDE